MCKQGVIIDSGATDHMVPSWTMLDSIHSAFTIVLLTDGTVKNISFQGLLQISVTDMHTFEQHIIPLMDALLVPGLWAVL